MYRSKTEEHLNIKTRGEKMAVFTTNWYLYKTHFKTTSGNSQTRNPRTANEENEPKKLTSLQILSCIDNEF